MLDSLGVKQAFWIPLAASVAALPLVASSTESQAEEPPTVAVAALQRRSPERATRGGGTRQRPAGRRGDPVDGPVDAPAVDLALRYFHMCDQDGDGFMSYREGLSSMQLDRDAFRAYDISGDGLCDEDEFRTRYEALIAKGGAFKPPRVAGEAEDARQRTRAAELIGEYDLDDDGLLGVDELEDVLFAHSMDDIDIEKLVDRVDIDGSGRFDVGETVGLMPFLLREVDPTEFMKARARTIEELYGMPEEREGGPDWAPEPPRIRGPIPVFYRLDLDRDRVVTEDDLKTLLRPLKVPVRLNTVIANLDEDGDGALNMDELRNSMTRPDPGR